MSEPPLHLIGHRLPGADVTLPPHVAWLWADAVGAEPASEVAHPSVAYLVAMQGSGMRVSELLELMGASPEDGPLLGETEIRLDAVLRPGETYSCAGGIVAVERKRGSRAGVFDLVRFEVEVAGSDGQAVAVCSYTWILPKRGE